MLKETPQEEGCLRGCLWSLTAGGGLGMILGYTASSFLVGHQMDRQLYLLLKWGCVTAGFLVGCVFWGIGQWVYVRFFMKGDEEEAV